MSPANREVIAARLAKPFQVVAGKGGVGRTIFASALAVRSAETGARTLLLEVNGPDSAAVRLGVAPAVDEPREVRDHLWLCRMTPRGSLREYALMVLKFKALYALVFENKLVKYLLRSIPSLAEFTMLGKAWYHAMERRSDGTPRYERVIVDAPATGHAITFLSVARTVADLAPPGIMKTASTRMAELVESKESTCLHIVCLPEEMPVNEGLEIARAADRRLHMGLGIGVVNRVLPPVVTEAERDVFLRLEARVRSEPELGPYAAASRRHMDREAWQAGHVARFEAECGMPVIQIPDLDHRVDEKEWLKVIGSVLDEAAGVKPPPAGAGEG